LIAADDRANAQNHAMTKLVRLEKSGGGGTSLLAAHPSRRPPAAGPQDEDRVCGRNLTSTNASQPHPESLTEKR
jgi:hypothetical protein